MSNSTDKTIPLNVRLKPSEPSAHPLATNYTNVGVAQGIAYLDFGFIACSSRPLSLYGLSGPIRDRLHGPNRPRSRHFSRVAMGVDVLARLQQQIQQMLVGLQARKQPKSKD